MKKSKIYFFSFLVLTFSVFATENSFIKLPTPIDGVHYISKTEKGSIYIRDNGISLVAKNILSSRKTVASKSFARDTYELHRVDLDFVNCNKDCPFLTPNLINTNDFIFIRGNRKEIFSSNEIIIKNIYTGIDFRAYFNEKNEFQFDFIVNPGANPNQIILKSEFQNNINLLENKSLNIDFMFDSATLEKPYSYQFINSTKQEIQSNFNLFNDIVTFHIGNYDKSKPLIIDPITRIMGSYYGGNGNDTGYDIEEDSQGNYYIAGFSESLTEIAIGGYQLQNGGLEDAYIAKFDNKNNRLWGTYFGSYAFEVGYAIDIDKDGNIILVGETSSDNNIATPNAHQTTYGGGSADGFIAKFTSTGELMWATYYGGTNEDKLNDVTTDSFGNIYAVGFTTSDDNISFNGYQLQRGGLYDAFIVKFNPLGVRQWATYYGGISDDFGNGITIDPNNAIYFIGSTQSFNGIAYQGNIPNLQGQTDAFISCFENDGNIRWGTYYGGSSEDNGISIKATDQYLYFAGSTKSTNNIAFNGFKNNLSGGWDGFVVKYGFLQQTYWGTYYGGASDDFINHITTKNPNIYIAGYTNSTSEINLIGWQQNYGGGSSDGTLAKFLDNGTMEWSTYYGGIGRDVLRSVSNKNKLLVAGFTNSNNNIGQNGYDNTYSQQLDAMFGEMSESELKLNLPSTEYCSKGEYTASISFTNITFSPSNEFIVELSDEYGSFDKPTEIGRKTSTNATDIVLNFPELYEYSKKYKVRLRSTLPLYAGVVSLDSITVYPTPSILSTLGTLCVNNSRLFTTNSIPNVTYQWEFQDGILTDASELSNTVRWANDGEFQVKLISNNPICSDTTVRIVKVTPLPDAKFEGSTAVCGLSFVNYTATKKKGYEYRWSVTEGSVFNKTEDGSATIYWNNISGKGEVSLTVRDSITGCMTSSSLTITISKKPIALITGPDTTCKGCTESYTANDDNISEWSVINGTKVSESNSEYSVKTNLDADSVIIRLVKSNLDNDCRDTNIKVVYLTDSPVTSISGLRSVCEYEESEYLTASNPDLNNNWVVTGGDIVNQSLNKVLIKWQKRGKGNLKLIQKAKDNSYLDSANIEVTINPKPDSFDYTIPNIICVGDTVPLSFKLKKGETVSITIDGNLYSNNDKYIFNESGIKNISFSISNEFDCSLKASFDINVKPLPDSPILVQKGETINSDKNGTHRWYIDGKLIEGENSNSLTLNEEGVYNAQYLSDGCWSEISNSISYTKSDVSGNIEETINLFPNPADDKIIIQSGNLITKLIIVDLLGKSILVEKNFLTKEIDISKLNSGIYFVKMWVNDKLQTKKIIVK